MKTIVNNIILNTLDNKYKQKQMKTTTKNKQPRLVLPKDKEQATKLWNSYYRANKTRRQILVSRYGYKIEKNFVNTLKERIK